MERLHATIPSEPSDLTVKRGQSIICLVTQLWDLVSLARDNHHKKGAIII